MRISKSFCLGHSLSEFEWIVFLAGCYANSQTHTSPSKDPVRTAKTSESGIIRGGFNSKYESSEGHEHNKSSLPELLYNIASSWPLVFAWACLLTRNSPTSCPPTHLFLFDDYSTLQMRKSFSDKNVSPLSSPKTFLSSCCPFAKHALYYFQQPVLQTKKEIRIL